MEREELYELRDSDPARYLEECLRAARNAPLAADRQLDAAWALDGEGQAEEAMRYYDRANELGVDEGDYPAFPLSYGASLRAFGRYEEATTVLAEAAEQNPEYLPLRILLGLTLASAGHSKLAVATLLEVILSLGSGDEELDGYEEALGELQEELLSEALAATST